MQRRIPNLCFGPACTCMACWKRGHRLSTAQLKHCKCSTIIYTDILLHTLSSLKLRVQFYECQSCLAEECIFSQILCFSLSDLENLWFCGMEHYLSFYGGLRYTRHYLFITRLFCCFAWNFKCPFYPAFDLFNCSGGHTCLRAVLRSAY